MNLDLQKYQEKYFPRLLKFFPRLLLLAFFSLQCCYLDAVPRWDAATYWGGLVEAVNATHAMTSWRQLPHVIMQTYNVFGHPAMGYFGLLVLGQLIDFPNLFILNITNALLATFSVFCVYKIFRWFLPTKTQLTEVLLGTALFALNPLFFATSIFLNTDFPVLVFFTAALACLLHARYGLFTLFSVLMIFSKETGMMYWVSILGGMGLYSALIIFREVGAKRWPSLAQLLPPTNNSHALTLPVSLFRIACLILPGIIFKFYSTAQKAGVWANTSVLKFDSTGWNCFGFNKRVMSNRAGEMFILNFHWLFVLIIIAALLIGAGRALEKRRIRVRNSTADITDADAIANTPESHEANASESIVLDNIAIENIAVENATTEQLATENVVANDPIAESAVIKATTTETITADIITTEVIVSENNTFETNAFETNTTETNNTENIFVAVEPVDDENIVHENINTNVSSEKNNTEVIHADTITTEKKPNSAPQDPLPNRWWGILPVLMSFLAFVTFNLSYITYIIPRYVVNGGFFLTLFLLLSLPLAINSKKIRARILSFVLVLLTLQTFWTIDPLSQLFFGSTPFGKHKILQIDSAGEAQGNGFVYNAAFAAEDKLFNLMHKAMPIKPDTSIITWNADPGYAWNTMGGIYVDKSTLKRTIDWRNGFPYNIIEISSISSAIAPPNAFYVYMPWLAQFSNEEKELTLLRQFYQISEPTEVSYHGYSLRFYSLTRTIVQ